MHVRVCVQTGEDNPFLTGVVSPFFRYAYGGEKHTTMMVILCVPACVFREMTSLCVHACMRVFVYTYVHVFLCMCVYSFSTFMCCLIWNCLDL